MTQLLLLFLIFFLAIAALLLNKHAAKFSVALGNSETQENLLSLFKKFSRFLFASVLVGLLFIFLNTKVSALIYLAFIMVGSAIFSVKIAKNIAV